MKIVLYYAMPKELDSLIQQRNLKPARICSGVSFYQISDDVTAVAGGIGKVNAAMATQLAIALCHPDLVINIGVAGCFKNVEIGTIMLADKFIQHDVDTTGCGDPIGLVSTVNQIEFSVSWPDLAKKAMDMTGLPYLVGTGATGDWFAKSGDRAKWIADTFHPLFIEMEGAAIAQVCLRNDVAFMALKSVSDCLFGNDKYEFNFPKAMENLNTVALQFVQNLGPLRCSSFKT